VPSQLNPYLHFARDAREALTRYQSVFGGELDLMTFGQYGTEGEMADGVMHATLTAPNGFVLMASDTPPGQTHTPGGQVSLSISGDDETELRAWFEALAEGGEVHVPLEKQMWGDVFGQCRDRFGITWLVDIAGA
jgi:PhnB protein